VPDGGGSAARRPQAGALQAHTLLGQARLHERAGRVEAAMADYTAAVHAAEAGGERTVLAEALRRLGALHHHRGEGEKARELCGRSHEVALSGGDMVLAAEALNALANMAFEAGEVERAHATYLEALRLGSESPLLEGRVEQNLGILANVRGDLATATAHYTASLVAFQRAGDDRGCAIAWHNLGMAAADQGRWDEAEAHFSESRRVAEAIGDLHLQALCLLNGSEVHLAHQRYEDARTAVESALRIFDQLGMALDKADAYKVLGVIFRETGRAALAEARLRAAIELAVEHGSVLSEAEASREMALLYRDLGRNQEALRLLNAAHRLFGRLQAARDQVDVAARVASLEGTFLAVVRDWGRSIESADTYTHGHCERVADYAARVGDALGLDAGEITVLRLGAYLHDLGKVRVPHEVLNKNGPLTEEEFDLIKLHPVWGVEMLAEVEFPWDIKPIIRWHHERYDGTGYPDRLRGDEIPLAAQIICVVDVYDALTTTRSYRAALSHDAALDRMRETRHWWAPAVFDAFLRAMDQAAIAA
jgi:putative nucleotidyltransferase with HDIG domain